MAYAPIHDFCKFFSPVIHTIFFPSQWLPSHITIVETMDIGERGMNPVARTIINSDFTRKQPREKSLLKTLWKKEKMLVIRIFYFSYDILYSSKNTIKFLDPFPDDKKLTWSKLRAFEDNKINVI